MELRVLSPEFPNLHNTTKEKRNSQLLSDQTDLKCQTIESFNLPLRAQGKRHARGQLGERGQSQHAGARRPGTYGVPCFKLPLEKLSGLREVPHSLPMSPPDGPFHETPLHSSCQGA